MTTDEADFQRTDSLLVALVDLVNRLHASGLSIGVTLSVRGQTVWGDVISHQSWRDRVGAVMRDAYPHDEGVGALASMFDFQSDPDLRAELEAEIPDDAPPPVHIHLADAVTVAGSGRFAENLWRGRLSEVSGWSLGKPSS